MTKLGYYRELGWYAKNLQVPQEWENKSVCVMFEGANQEVKVYLNGNLVGAHVEGYMAFSFNISEHLAYGEENTLLVRVDNSHNENIPLLNANYTFYGGLPQYRDYWTSYSFGDLNEVVKTRKDILEKLVQRLKINNVAMIEGKFQNPF